MPPLQPTWLRPDGTLDEAALLAAFRVFWRQHGEPLLKTASYHEIAPHLVLMEFLHRVVNGGGRLEREYAIGSGRMDLLLTYGEQKLAMERKVWRAGGNAPKDEGLQQLDGYPARIGLARGWLVIFDWREHQGPLADRTNAEHVTSPGGRAVTVVRASGGYEAVAITEKNT